MAFALTKFSLQFEGTDSAGKYRGRQYATLHITAANTDVDLDIGDDSGTFWTAALADGTYGSLATEAQAKLQEIDDVVEDLMAVSGEAILARRKVAAASGAGEYSLAIQNARPNIGFFSGDAPTSYVVELEWLLSPEKSGLAGDYNI